MRRQPASQQAGPSQDGLQFRPGSQSIRPMCVCERRNSTARAFSRLHFSGCARAARLKANKWAGEGNVEIDGVGQQPQACSPLFAPNTHILPRLINECVRPRAVVVCALQKDVLFE
jgi:hypothetical protein